MPQPLTSESLQGLRDTVTAISKLDAMGSSTGVYIEWPERFPVVSSDGYSLGNIYREENDWVFESH